MEYTQSEVVKQQALTASTTYPFDLGIQGLSFLWIDITELQNAANTSVEPDDVLAAISSINVTVGGANIISGRAKDLMRIGSIIAGVPPSVSFAANATNAETHVSFFLPFGRYLFDTKEGYPAVKRGMLQIAITAAAAFTPGKTVKVSIHQVEVPGNTFGRYNKYTMRTATPASTGLNDIPLPIGNWLRGVYAAGSTLYRDSNSMGSFNQTLLMVDNTEKYWTGGITGHANHQAIARMRQNPAWMPHRHISDVGAAYAQFQSTDPAQVDQTPIEAFSAWLDLDPRRDDAFTLETSGKNLLSLRLDMAIAEQVWVYAYESVRSQ